MAVLPIGMRAVRPFIEVAARMMRLGYVAATVDAPCEDRRATADRFGIAPLTVEQYIAAQFCRM